MNKVTMINGARKELQTFARCIYSDHSKTEPCSGWGAFFLLGIFTALVAAEAWPNPSPIALSLIAIATFSFSLSSFFARGMSVVEFSTFAFAFYVILAQLGELNNSTGYWLAFGLVASLVLLLILERFVRGRPLSWAVVVLALFLLVVLLVVGLTCVS